MKKWRIKNRIADETFIKVSNESKTMAQAASKLGLHFNSLKKRALELNCYNPNQAGIGIRKNTHKIPLKAIIHDCKHPQYQTYKLKVRLLAEGIKKNECELCGTQDWNGQPLNMELDHIDGIRTNHRLDNLRMLCPNCHSQTSTYRGKNKKD